MQDWQKFAKVVPMTGPTGMIYALSGVGTSTLSVERTAVEARLTESEVAEKVQQALTTLPPFPFERPTGTAEEALEYYRVSTACRVLSGHALGDVGRWVPVEFDKGIFFAPEEQIRHPITVAHYQTKDLYAIHIASHIELCGYTWA